MELLLKGRELLTYALVSACLSLMVALALLAYAAVYFALQSENAKAMRFLGLVLCPPRLLDELYIGPSGPEPPTAHARRIRKWFGTAMQCFLLAMIVALAISLPLIKIVQQTYVR